ncbi:uncharacterized protein B0T23DRAFT_47976 [Neurospora hispaniola]|uniref:Uncharacterized protein n=1 Tax=Neurospora hispaniola TaxID=588809 RepID=A0AAJ0HYW1_9PEZI|nr:hypothetical protein B0T23DRAFT_47976 [Neurospora hispaniola]
MLSRSSLFSWLPVSAKNLCAYLYLSSSGIERVSPRVFRVHRRMFRQVMISYGYPLSIVQRPRVNRQDDKRLANNSAVLHFQHHLDGTTEYCTTCDN